MIINKQAIRRGFNRAKSTYDSHCQLQAEIGKSLIAAVNRQGLAYQNIVDLGCGTGLVTQMLENTCQHQLLMAIDIAEELLKLSRVRLATPTQVIWADFDNIPSGNQQFNLVFSNMALQWSVNLGATLTETARVTKNNGLLAVSLPINDTFSELKHLLWQLTGNHYLNEFMSIQHIIVALQNAGYQIIENNLIRIDYMFANLSEALLSLKRIGALGNANTTWLDRSLLKMVDSKINLNYVIAYLLAVKI